jgi:hypothetical protein
MTNFFNSYASPIFRNTLYKKYYNQSCSIKQEPITFNTLIEGLETAYQNDGRYKLYTVYIDGHTITFTMLVEEGKSAHISFEVDFTHKRKDLAKRIKIKIVKWLLAVWAIEKHNYKEYIAAPCTEGDIAGSSWRGHCYSKFGFEWVSPRIMVYKP